MESDLTQDQISTLSGLSAAFSDLDYVLIGATALKLQMPDFTHGTEDFDLLIMVTVDNFNNLKSILSGWEHNDNEEHRWKSPEGIIVDIIPICPSFMDGNILKWPKNKNIMNLTGYQNAFEHAQRIQVSDDLGVPMAPVHVIGLLKIIAFLDDPIRRAKDLDHIMFIFTNYVEEFDERRFNSEIIDAEIDYEFQSAYLLGNDLVEIINSEEKAILENFIRKAEDEDDEHQIQVRLNRSSRMYPNESNTETLGFISAFKSGLGFQ